MSDALDDMLVLRVHACSVSPGAAADVRARLKAERGEHRRLVLRLAERIAVCSELLGKRAERRAAEITERDYCPLG